MEIIKPMKEEKFDVVCDAGVKLIEQLKLVLRSSGLGPDQAANVLAMATGGVIKSLNIDPGQFLESTSICCRMWRQEDGVKGLNGAVFDPPHKRPGFVPVSRDPMTEN